MGERNPLLLICPWEGPVSALNHETTSWCTCVFLGGLPCKRGLDQNCGVWDQSPGQKGSGGRSWAEPAPEQWLCSGVCYGKPHQSSSDNGHEENHSWGKNSGDAGLDAAVLFFWGKEAHLCLWLLDCKISSLQAGLAVMPKVQPSHLPHFPLYPVKQYLWNCQRGGFLFYLGFFGCVCVNKDQ